MSNLFASFQRAAGRRTLRRGWFRPAALPLRLEGLEPRDVPSFSFPLSGTDWVQTGPQNIAATGTGEVTSSPGNLTSSGRVTGVAISPTDPNVFYVGTAGGGVAKTLDGGTTWQMLTDRLPPTTQLVTETFSGTTPVAGTTVGTVTTSNLPDGYRSLSIGAIALSKVDPNVIYAGEGEPNNSGDSYPGNGILRSRDGGATWNLLSAPFTYDDGTIDTTANAFVDSYISRIITLPNPAAPTDATKDLLFVSVQAGDFRLKPGSGNVTGSAVGVYRSEDGGQTFRKISVQLTTPYPDFSNTLPITDIAVDPSNPNVAYLSVGTSAAGATNSLYNGLYKTTNALSTSPSAAGSAGTQWTTIFGGNGSFVVAGNLIGRTNFVVAPSSPSTIYALIADGQSNGLRGVFRSLDGGTNWQKFASTTEGGNLPNFLPTQGFYNIGIAVDPTNANRVALVGTLTYEVVYTENATATDPTTLQPSSTWSNLALDAQGQGPHADAHTVAFGPLVAGADRRQIWVGSDGGIFRTQSLTAGGNGVVTPDWVSANGVPGPYALNSTQYVGIGLSPANPDQYVGGTQDNGELRFNDTGATIASVDLQGNPITVPKAYAQPVVDGGDGGDVVYDFVNANNVYHVAPVASRGATGFIRKSTDGGVTWADAANGITNPASSLFYPPISIDPSQSNRLFVGTDALNESTDSAASWHQLNNIGLPFVTGVTPVDGGPKPVVTSIGISRSNPNVVYVAVINRGYGSPVVSYGPAIYQFDLNRRVFSTIGEAAWHDISPSGTTANGGASTARGTPPDFDDSLNDPSQPGLTMPPITGAAAAPAANDLNFFETVTALTVDPYDWRIVYATTDDHRIFRTTDGGVTWRRMNTAGLPNGATQQSFNDIAIDPNMLLAGGQSDDDLYIATDIGVYKLSNPTLAFANQQWVRLGGNDYQTTAGVTTSGYQPDARVDDLEINTSLGILASATHGRGVWQFSIRPYVSGVVFLDVNADGVNAPANATTGVDPEPAISGARVVATNITPGLPGTPFEAANTTTDGRGFYVFRSLQNGSYLITPSLKDSGGNEVLASTAAVDKTTQYEVTTPPRVYSPVDQTSTEPNTNIGLFARTSISGVKFDDLNGNGVKDAGEPGIPGVTIQLTHIDPTTQAVVVDATTTTGTDGSYSFTGLGVVQNTSGSTIDPTTKNPTPAYTVVPYLVREVLPTGYVQSTLNPAGITLTSGTPVTGVNIGNFKLVSAAGKVYEDVDGNGVLGAGEPGLANVTVQIFNTVNLTTPVETVTSGSDGTFTFTNLGPGTYRVREVLPTGYAQTSVNPADFTAASGQNVIGYNFGDFRAAGFSGTAYEDVNGNGVRDAGDGAAIPGATVELLGAGGAVLQTTTTDASGGYTFTGLFPLTQGNTTPYQAVVVAPAVYAQTNPNPSVFVTSGTVQTGKDLGLFRRTTVSGEAFQDTNGNGVQDAGEAPFVGASVALLNYSTRAVVATTTTDGAGNFTFANVGPITDGAGNQVGYSVSANPAGYVQTTPDVGQILLQSGVPVGGISIGLFQSVAFTGRTFIDANGNGAEDAGEPGDPGRTVQLINVATGAVAATAVSDAAGNYTVSGGPGTFTLREAPAAGFVQTTANPGNTATTSGQTVPATDFGSFRLATISGTVFNDKNGNGVLESGDTPLAGWAVQLVRATDGTVLSTQTTAANGTFTFTNVGPGQYTVTEVVQSPYVPSTTASVPESPVSGQAIGLAFGNYAPGVASGQVYEDLDRSGTANGAEAGVAGFTVQILNAAGAVVNSTTTTATGAFAVGSLPPGAYTAAVVLPAGWVRTSAANPSFTVTSGQTVGVGQIGVLRLASIAGSVFLDSNRDGVRQSFEKGEAGATVNLLNQTGTQIASQQVGTDGTYLFLGLQSGTYTVQLATVPTGFAVSGASASTQQTVAVATGSTSANNALASVNFGLTGRQRYAIGADGGGGPRVQVYDAQSGQLLQDFFVYEPTFTGGVRVAEADVNGDGVDDLIVAAGPGGGPRVRVIDGASGAVIFDKFVYEPSFNAGLYVTSGDVNGDGYSDIITGTSAGGAPRVTVYSGKDGSQIADYFAYDSNFRGGVRVGAGDVNGDGVAEVITAPGPGMAATVITWNATNLAPLTSFLAFDASFTGGAFVAGGPAGPSGRADVVVGSGVNYPSTPVVRTFNGATGDIQLEVPAFGPAADGSAYQAEVRVASFDVDGDGIPDLAVASGPGSPPRIRFLSGLNRRQIGGEIQPYESTFTGGVYIG